MEEYINKVKEFRDERNWNQYHHALDLAVAMNIEISEVLELIRFKSREEVEEFLRDERNKKEFGHEIADVFIFMLALCESANIDLDKAFREKLEINKNKYPVNKAYNNKDKYTKL